MQAQLSTFEAIPLNSLIHMLENGTMLPNRIVTKKQNAHNGYSNSVMKPSLISEEILMLYLDRNARTSIVPL